MGDRIIAPIAFLMFALFVGFMAFSVNKLNLWGVVSVVIVLALIDFWKTLRAGSRDLSQIDQPEKDEGGHRI